MVDVPQPETTADALFISWYEQEWPRVVALLASMTLDRSAAEDLASEAFTRAYVRWSTLESPSAWVATVAVNLAKRPHRSHAKESVSASPPEVPTTDDASDVELLSLLRMLSARQRTVIALRYIYGFSQAEIAAACGVRPGTVAATLHKARRKLSHHIGVDE